MSRVNIDQNRQQGAVLVNASKFGVMNQVLTGTLGVPKDAPTLLFLDANGAARNVDFPAVTADMRGQFFVVKNTAGAAFALTLRNAAAATIGDLLQGESAMVVCDGTVGNTGWHVLMVGAST